METILNNILEDKDVCLICSSAADLEDSVSSNSFLWLGGDDEDFVTIGDILCYLLKKQKNYYSNITLCNECSKNAVTSYKFILQCESNEKAMNQLLLGLNTITDMTAAGLTNRDKAAFMQIDTEKGKFNAFCDTQVMQSLSETLDRFNSILNSVSNTNNETNYDDDSESDESTKSSEFDPNECEDYSDYSDSEIRQPVYCGVCRKRFKNNYRLNSHIDQVHRPKIFDCAICQRKFGSPDLLKRHMNNSHDHKPPHKPCHICGKLFAGSTSLHDHITSHSMNLQCEKCMKKFTSNNSFLKHKGRGNCNKPLVERQNLNCNECEAKFTTNLSLKNHIAFKHRGISHFLCDICSEKFPNKATLDGHVRKVHTKDRPAYPCTQCGRVFYTKTYLKTHIRMAHTKEFGTCCYYCDAKFYSANDRAAHVAKMHSGKTFPCDLCNVKFLTLSRLSRHQQSLKCKGLQKSKGLPKSNGV